jgi:hypothetical protein
VLICDERTPDVFKNMLEKYPAEKMYFNFEGYNWKGSKHSSKNMQRAVDLECIGEVVASYLKEEKGQYIITSRCDSDDAISIEHINKIQENAMANWKGRPFWLNLVRGYKWCDNHVYPVGSLYNPFISFVEPSGKNLLTTYQTCHTECTKTPYDVVNIREGNPTWLQVIHGGNLLNKLMRVRGKKPQEEVLNLFRVKI